jgi:hypothetical protein
MLVLGLVAIAALGAVTATGASAKEKPELILKSKGKVVANGEAVGGGWAVGIETSETPDMIYGCELEGSMKLVTNSSTKADLASGSVGVPAEECGEYEIEGEEPAIALLKRSHHARHRERSRHGARPQGVSPDVEELALKDPKFIGGDLESEEVTTKMKGTLELSKALEVSGEEAGKKCTYVSKTKLKGEWPAVEYPGTADIESEFDFKLAKGSTKGCVKEEEGYVEAWLGPDYEELEADLT